MDDSINEHPSGFHELLGYDVIEWSAECAVLELAIADKHLNRSGVLHGGVLTSLIDSACGYAGCFCSTPGHVRRAVTLSLNTSFLAQSKDGKLTAKGWVYGGGRKIFFARAEVYNENGDLLASGDGTFKYRSGSDDPRGVPADPALGDKDGTGS